MVFTNPHTHTDGAGVAQLPAFISISSLQWERSSLRDSRGWVQSVGAGAGGVGLKDGGSKAGPRADDGAAAAAGGGTGGAAGQTLSAEEQ